MPRQAHPRFAACRTALASSCWPPRTLPAASASACLCGPQRRPPRRCWRGTGMTKRRACGMHHPPALGRLAAQRRKQPLAWLSWQLLAGPQLRRRLAAHHPCERSHQFAEARQPVAHSKTRLYTRVNTTKRSNSYDLRRASVGSFSDCHHHSPPMSEISSKRPLVSGGASCDSGAQRRTQQDSSVQQNVLQVAY